jgi:hypothetical protein
MTAGYDRGGCILVAVGRLNRDWVAGAMLVLVGCFLLGVRLFPDLVPFVPLTVGLGLLVLFLATKSNGALVAGGIVTGLGLGILVATNGSPEVGAAGIFICLALGFFLIWVLGLMFGLSDVRWWPLVPGSLLLAAGVVAASLGLGPRLMGIAVDWWPLLLVIAGAYLLLHARLRGHLAPEDDETSMVPAVGPTIGVIGESRADVVQRGQPPVVPPRPEGAHHPDDYRSTAIGGDTPGSLERV